MNHLRLQRLFFICLAVLAAPVSARFYPPVLEHITGVGDALKSIGNHGSLEIDDQQRLCILEKKGGFYCFDGKQVEHLADNVFGLVPLGQERDKKLVFSLKNQMYQWHQGQMQLFSEQPTLELEENIVGLYQGGMNSFFVATTKNIFHFDGAFFKKITEPPSKVYIYFIRQINDDWIEIATSKGVIALNLATGDKKHFLKGKKVYYLYKNYALTAQGLFLNHEKISDQVFYHAIDTLDNKVLLAGPKGLCYLQKKLLCPQKNANGKVYTTLLDTFGNLWAATTKGIMFSPFSHVEYINQKNGFHHDNVLSLLTQQDKLYVGTENGVSVLNLSNGDIEHIQATRGDTVSSLLMGEDDYLWVGTTKGLYRYNLLSGEKESTLLKKELITWMVAHHNQIIASSYYSGVFVLDAAGYLIKDNIESYTQKISKIAQCNNQVYLGTQFNGVRKLDDNLRVSYYTNKADYSIISCYQGDIASVNSNQQLSLFDNALTAKQRFQMSSEVNSLVEDDDILWILHDTQISRWQSGKEQQAYPAPLQTLYNNIATRYGEWIFAGSPEGLAVINTKQLQNYQPPASDILLSSSTDNTSGTLTIKPRFSNLVDMLNNQDIVFRTSNNDNFMVLEERSLVFPEGLPKAMSIEFKGLQGRHNSTKATTFEDTSATSLYHTSKNLLSHHPLLLMVVLVLQSVIIVGLYKNIRSKNAKLAQWQAEPQADKKTIKNIDATPHPKHAKLQANPSAPSASLLKSEKSAFANFDDFCARLEAVLQEPDDEYLLLLKSCNTFLTNNARVYQAKELANYLNVDTKKIERTLKRYFNSAAIKEYQRLFLRYHQKVSTKKIAKIPV